MTAPPRDTASQARSTTRQRQLIVVLQIIMGVMGVFVVTDILSGAYETACVNAVGAVGTMLVWRFTKRPTTSLVVASRLGLGVAGTAIIALAMLTGQGESSSSWFLAGIPLAAGYFLSAREARGWTVGAIGAVFAIHASRYLFTIESVHASSPYQGMLERIMLTVVVGVTAVAVRERMDETLQELAENEKVLREQTKMLAEARDGAFELARTKSEFLANMSHEIRTPLNGVVGMTDVLMTMDMPDTQRSVVTTIATSGRSLLGVVNDILDFSKLESNGLVIEHVAFNPRRVVGDVLELFAHAAWTKGIDLAQSIEGELPRSVIGDGARVRQVLANLVGNAVKFTDAGEVLVKFGVEGTTTLWFSVVDTGPGIPSERLGDLFADFSQLDASTTRKFGGTGLGLSISRRLVDLMGGTIKVESALNEGSKFRFTVAVAPAVMDEQSAASELVPRYLAVMSPLPGTRRSIEQLGRRLGMTMVGASDLETLIDSTQNRDDSGFDAIVVSAAYGDGLSKVVKDVRERYASARLWLLAAPGDQTARAHVKALNLDCLVHKPISEQRFRRALETTFSVDGEAFGPVSIPRLGALGARMPLNILVAEDNPVNQLVIRKLLAALGYDVTIVSNGREVVEHALAKPYDLILMDVHMPELDGVQACTEIRKHDADVTIVALTASVLDEKREACVNAGMNDFLTKPIQLATLSKMLESSFRIRQTMG